MEATVSDIPCYVTAFRNGALRFADTARYFRVIRGNLVHDHVSAEHILLHSLQLDSDVHEYDRSGCVLADALVKHGHKFLTNACFASAGLLQQYLSSRGKLPDYLALEGVDAEYTVVARQPIEEQTYLGQVQGIIRPAALATTLAKYNFPLYGITGNLSGCVDTENILFSDWTRFMRPSLDPAQINVTVTPLALQLLVHAVKPISAGTELRYRPLDVAVVQGASPVFTQQQQ